jgi:hypothetical protein
MLPSCYLTQGLLDSAQGSGERVCVYVCVREREREGEGEYENVTPDNEDKTVYQELYSELLSYY